MRWKCLLWHEQYLFYINVYYKQVLWHSGMLWATGATIAEMLEGTTCGVDVDSLHFPPSILAVVVICFPHRCCIHWFHSLSASIPSPLNTEACPAGQWKVYMPLKLCVEPNEKITVTKVGWNQIHVVLRFSKVGRGTYNGSHRVVEPRLRALYKGAVTGCQEPTIWSDNYITPSASTILSLVHAYRQTI